MAGVESPSKMIVAAALLQGLTLLAPVLVTPLEPATTIADEAPRRPFARNPPSRRTTPSRAVDGFATHLPALLGAVAATDGPVLELGSGLFSTPILDTVCQGRGLVTVESDPEWLERFLHLERPGHRFRLAGDWATLPELDARWDVAIVDQSPSYTRAPSIERLRARTRFLVIHDTEHPEHYRYEPLLASFAHRADFLGLGQRTRTTVVSDHAPLPFAATDVTQNHAPVALGAGDVQLRAGWRELDDSCAPVAAGRRPLLPVGRGQGGRLRRRHGRLAVARATTRGPVTNRRARSRTHARSQPRARSARDAPTADGVVVHVVFTDGVSGLFWLALVPGAADHRGGSFTCERGAAQPVPPAAGGPSRPRWSDVTSIVLRAKASDPAVVTLTGLQLLAGPAARIV